MAKADTTLTVLVASDQPDTVTRLRGLFDHTRWLMEVAGTIRDAIAKLRAGKVGVVIAENELTDGTWEDLLKDLPDSNRPNLIVTARHADERLWNHVLASGGFDVLDRPLDGHEVFRIISLAGRDWIGRRSVRTRMALPPARSEPRNEPVKEAV
ncbi:MAG: response regulator [Acidobacteria bacterium]|nr:response regulator [Acidobacteriota bacterium]